VACAGGLVDLQWTAAPVAGLTGYLVQQELTNDA
jgi:hypothetical protein